MNERPRDGSFVHESETNVDVLESLVQRSISVVSPDHPTETATGAFRSFLYDLTTKPEVTAAALLSVGTPHEKDFLVFRVFLSFDSPHEVFDTVLASYSEAAKIADREVDSRIGFIDTTDLDSLDAEIEAINAPTIFDIAPRDQLNILAFPHFVREGSTVRVEDSGVFDPEYEKRVQVIHEPPEINHMTDQELLLEYEHLFAGLTGLEREKEQRRFLDHARKNNAVLKSGEVPGMVTVFIPKENPNKPK